MIRYKFHQKIIEIVKNSVKNLGVEVEEKKKDSGLEYRFLNYGDKNLFLELRVSPDITFKDFAHIYFKPRSSSRLQEMIIEDLYTPENNMANGSLLQDGRMVWNSYSLLHEMVEEDEKLGELWKIIEESYSVALDVERILMSEEFKSLELKLETIEKDALNLIRNDDKLKKA